MKPGPQLKPRALDLFCGGGGAARGLIAAGFDVVGVDIRDHHRSYPGPFVVGDATQPPLDVSAFDLVWASPPCQAFSRATPTMARDAHPNLLPATRTLLRTARRSVIENVPGAPVRKDITLDGPMCGLPEISRTRVFELSGFWMWQPTRKRVIRARTPIEASKRGGKRDHNGVHGTMYVSKEDTAKAMGLPSYMTCAQIGEAVPPPYAEIIGRAAMLDILRDGRRPGRRA